MSWIFLLTYLSIIVFVIVAVAKIVKYASTPIHLRWELYPVAHEPHRHYGGSYFEELDWWTKPRKKVLWAELWAMFEEIVFLKGVYHNNRSLWVYSFPFHLGLYLIVVFIGLLFLGAITQIFGAQVALSSSGWGFFLYRGTQLAGVFGFFLTGIGSLGLYNKRKNDPNLENYTAPIDYFNLWFLLIISVISLIAWLFSDFGFSQLRNYIAHLISFNFSAKVSFLAAIQILLGSLFLLYMPFTRMMHFIAKYFTYHEVRWEDEPNLPKGALEARIKKALNYGVSWSAPHIRSGKTWAQLATEEENNES